MPLDVHLGGQHIRVKVQFIIDTLAAKSDGKSGPALAWPADQKYTFLKIKALLCDAVECLVCKQGYAVSDKILLRHFLTQSFLKGILQTASFILLNEVT